MIAPIGKMLVAVGIVLVAVGSVILLFNKIGITRLPGDILFRRGGVTFFFPIVTCIALSVVLSLIMSLVARLRH